MSNNLCAHKNCLILALGHCLNGVTVIYCNAIKTVIYHAFFSHKLPYFPNAIIETKQRTHFLEFFIAI